MLIAGLASVVRLPDADVPPADVPFEQLAIPRTIHPPSPWGAGTSDLDHNPGPLAAIGSAPRKRVDGFRGVVTQQELFGISAVDGSAVFIDAPEVPGTFVGVGDTAVALSPDGTQIGFVRYRGPRSMQRGIVGWDVYDTETGEWTPLRVPRLDTITGTDAFSIRLSGDSRYLLTNFSRSGSNGSRDDSLVVWDTEISQRHVAERTGYYYLPNPGSGPHGIVWSRGRRMFTFDPETRQTEEQAVPQELVEGWYADDGETLAYIGQQPTSRNQAAPWRLYVVEPSAETPREIDTGIEPGEILGWCDDSHLVVSSSGPRLARVVDLEDGTTEKLGLSQSGPEAMVPLYAADLFANPLVAGQEQPDAQDPRPWLHTQVQWVAVGLLLGGVLQAWLVLRRRRGRA